MYITKKNDEQQIPFSFQVKRNIEVIYFQEITNGRTNMVFWVSRGQYRKVSYIEKHLGAIVPFSQNSECRGASFLTVRHALTIPFTYTNTPLTERREKSIWLCQYLQQRNVEKQKLGQRLLGRYKKRTNRNGFGFISDTPRLKLTFENKWSDLRSTCR